MGLHTGVELLFQGGFTHSLLLSFFRLVSLDSEEQWASELIVSPWAVGCTCEEVAGCVLSNASLISFGQHAVPCAKCYFLQLVVVAIRMYYTCISVSSYGNPGDWAIIAHL